MLSDHIMKEEKGLSGPQWRDILVSRFDQSVRDNAPMVVPFNSSISGSCEYLDAYKEFIGYALLILQQKLGSSAQDTGELYI